MRQRISVIGTGYLGATHAACLAELGFQVLGVDSDSAKIAVLSSGVAPFREPGLDDLLTRHVRSGRLRFSTDLRHAAAHADIHFLCVGTPQQPGAAGADLTAVFAVTDQLATHLRRDALVIGKSTVPVGTAAQIHNRMAASAPVGISATVAWNPEFLREGHAVEDTLRPDRLVFGVPDTPAEATLRSIYASPIDAGTPVHVTDVATAELAKGAANAFLATKISFINALAEMSDCAGADILGLADILGADARIGRRFLDAGLGFGGGCLPKDIRALGARAAELGAPSVTALLEHVDTINKGARHRVFDLARTTVGGRLSGVEVAVLGASFKPLSDDVRDSPALDVAGRLSAAGAAVRVYDPEANVNARSVHPELTYVANADAALVGADLVLHLTDWPEFAALDPHHVGSLVRNRRMIDARNKLDADRWREAGWSIHGVGRGDRSAVAPASQPPAAVIPHDLDELYERT